MILIKEDIAWVVEKALQQMAIALETYVSAYRPEFVSVCPPRPSIESTRQRIRVRFDKEKIRDTAWKKALVGFMGEWSKSGQVLGSID